MTRKTGPSKRATRRAARGIAPAAWLALAGLLLVAVGLLVVRGSGAGSDAATRSVPLQATGKPKLVVDREKIDFGRVPLDKPVKATFKLSNAGDRALSLAGTPQVQVVEGCWPPRAVVGSTTIQPGQSTDLSMEFMMHAGMEGPHDFLVSVKTNDPDQPVTELHVLSDWEK